MTTSERKYLKGSIMVKLTLVVGALVAVGIAGTILLAPEVFYASYGIEVAGNTTLINELKAPAGVLLVAGLLMLAGVFRAGFVQFSLTMATVIYLPYGLSRFLSMATDGHPGANLISAAWVEIGIGVACLLALLWARNSTTYSTAARN